MVPLRAQLTDFFCARFVTLSTRPFDFPRANFESCARDTRRENARLRNFAKKGSFTFRAVIITRRSSTSSMKNIPYTTAVLMVLTSVVYRFNIRVKCQRAHYIWVYRPRARYRHGCKGRPLVNRLLRRRERQVSTARRVTLGD